MPKDTVSQSLIRNLCPVAKRYEFEFAPDQARAQWRSHHITRSTGHTGQTTAKLAQSSNGTDTVPREVG